jgi:hypothetical protein
LTEASLAKAPKGLAGGGSDRQRLPTLSWADPGGEPRLRLTGLAPDQGFDLAVVAGDDLSLLRQAQPTAGRFVATALGIDFVPRFPFLPDAKYSLLVAPCAEFPEGLVLGLRREMPMPEPTATITAIHPEAEIVPLNLLKVYVQFSEPMAEGFARQGVRVENAETGEPLDGVFLDMDPELWDPGRQRLTLLLDPGRLKRGLVPHREAGYPLEEGTSIRLRIGARFTSASGAPIAEPLSRVYKVGPAFRRPVHPSDWRLEFPGEGSSDPLRIAFDRPLDHAMLRRAFQVIDADCNAVPGIGAALPGETGWTFRPSRLWGRGPHELIVDTRLEDLAGNSLRRVFDRDLAIASDFVTQSEAVAISLRAGP